MKHESFYVGSDGRPSAFDITLSSVRDKLELVLFCHGYKGFKNWGPWDLVAERFAQSGYDFLKFNFSHNGGTKDEPIDFPDIESFAENTYTKELEDIKRILKKISNGLEIGSKKINYKRVHVIGHSRGGGMAILAASKFSGIDSLTTWASVADFSKRFNFDLEKWKQDGVTHVKNSRTGQMLPHNYSFYSDFIANRDELDIPAASKKLNLPWLIAHGEDDEAVCLSNADYLKNLNHSAKLLILRDTGHTFGGSHPWKESSLPPKLKVLTDHTIRFLSS